MTDTLHIVCLDAPSPPDYGGAIDMYYKIEALAAAGTKIILHYFDYKRERNSFGLNDICKEVHAYKRNSWFIEHLKRKPYIVSSRINQDLVKRLNQDNLPVLFEGLHTTGILPYLKNKKRKILVRMHNNEAVYYQQLAKTESNNILKKLYYKVESLKLKSYQNQLDRNIPIACISVADINEFKSAGFTTAFHLPAFIPFSNVSIKSNTGDFCLYHGNLSIAENSKVALWLIKHVFSKNSIRLVIAGRNIPPEVKSYAKPFSHISLMENPTKEEMDECIKNAQVHVLPSFNATGVKLKLINALLRGRHCIVNHQAVEGSGLEPYCHIAHTATEFSSIIYELMQKPLGVEEIEKRKEILELYDNYKNARLINAYLQ